jgi:hypothetical protein
MTSSDGLSRRFRRFDTLKLSKIDLAIDVNTLELLFFNTFTKIEEFEEALYALVTIPITSNLYSLASDPAGRVDEMYVNDFKVDIGVYCAAETWRFRKLYLNG